MSRCSSPLSLVTALAATGCSGDDGPSIVVYNAQHEQLLEEIAPTFTDEDRDRGRAAQRQRPRAGRPAHAGGRRLAGRRLPDRELTGDVALSRARACSPRWTRQHVDPIPAQYRPESGDWTGFVARSTVLVYNTSMVDEADLPDSIMDLADPE